MLYKVKKSFLFMMLSALRQKLESIERATNGLDGHLLKNQIPKKFMQHGAQRGSNDGSIRE